ncbi:aminoglycoside 6-adenylyltransferase [Paenibacillus thiaminolyticus]|uniref:aminoglycoside 6-adenylyltransferase n=1 Tax=Paenibacillus thiaminolyticus TaxID=49283 RepID=UPI003B981B4A
MLSTISTRVARPNLLRIMAWQIGSEQGYAFSIGKNYKFIDRYLPNEDWDTLLSTYSQNGYEQMTNIPTTQRKNGMTHPALSTKMMAFDLLKGFSTAQYAWYLTRWEALSSVQGVGKGSAVIIECRLNMRRHFLVLRRRSNLMKGV